MSDADLYNGVAGGYTLIAEGLNLERFLNKCFENKIYLSDVKRISYTKIRFKVSTLGYIKIKKINKESKYDIKLVSEKGIGKSIGFIKKRVLIIPFICLFIFFAIFSSNYIWSVEYRGFNEINRFEVEEMLYNMGLCRGVNKDSVNRKAMEAAIRANYPKAAWVNIFFKGTKCYVDVVEGIDIPEIYRTEGRGMIVAKKDGYVVDTRIYAGTNMTEVGKTVKKGDILISGDIYKDGEYKYSLLPRGEILAKVWSYGREISSLTQTVEKRTGRVYNARYIEIFGKLFLLPGSGKTDFENYETEIIKCISAGKNMPFGFNIYEAAFYETVTAKIEKDENKLIIELTESAFNKAMANIADDKSITDIKRNIQKYDDKMEVFVIIETTEDIGVIKEN